MLNDFEQKVIKGFENSGVILENCKNLGIAVSGGADSISLLLSLSRIQKYLLEKKNKQLFLKVISVNHFIRPDEETCGDIEFVQQICSQMALKKCQITFFKVELEKGVVKSTEAERKMGIEEAARFLRYNAFDTFIKNEDIDFLCLAHNHNDQMETILMRFLQGASCDSSGGIPVKRGKYIRPLLNISRSEIEGYLSENNFSWRTDKSNFDTKYLRNRIRNQLIPFLDENFHGWQKAVTGGAEKSWEDSEFIGSHLNEIEIKKEFKNQNKKCFVENEIFFGECKTIQKRLLLKMCNEISENSRIPDKFLKEVLTAFKDSYPSCKKTDFMRFPVRKIFADLEIYLEKEFVCVKKVETEVTDFVFSDIIEKEGNYFYDFGLIKAVCTKEGFARISVVFSENESKEKILIDEKQKKKFPVFIKL